MKKSVKGQEIKRNQEKSEIDIDVKKRLEKRETALRELRFIDLCCCGWEERYENAEFFCRAGARRG